jgi:GNAT superfamily N-acetyltransferase
MPTVNLLRADYNDPRAAVLRTAMDNEMGILYFDSAARMTSEISERMSNALVVDPSEMVATVLVMDGDTAIGHAALRPYGDAFEVKRVFVDASARGRGVARVLMLEMENIARERGISKLVLQTGGLQIGAIRLYESLGYLPIPSFRGYEAVPGGHCFAKSLV